MHQSRIRPLALAKLLDSSPFPVYLLDEDRTIVFCNAACAEWTGIAASELVGLRCEYHSEGPLPGAAAVAAGICPPPSAFGGVRQSGEAVCPAADGTLLRRRGDFIPLADGSDGSAPVLAILEPDDSNAENPADGNPPAATELHDQLWRFRRQWRDRYSFDQLIGQSPAAMRIRAQVSLATATAANVLIVGPAGSGKQHVAKAIHYLGGQLDARSLVPLACSVLGAELLRSTLSAILARHAGLDKPLTVLMNDADELPLEIQSELAALLKNPPPGLRVIATTTRPLEALVAQEKYLDALACQLMTLRIDLPPLVERRDDLPLLAQAFLEATNAEGGKQVEGFSVEALDRLSEYGWPGNIDELAKIVKQAHAACQSTRVEVADLPERLRLAAEAALYPRREDAIVLEDFLAQVETELIERALRRAKGNKSKAAKLLGLTRPRLYRRLIQLGLIKESEAHG